MDLAISDAATERVDALAAEMLPRLAGLTRWAEQMKQ